MGEGDNDTLVARVCGARACRVGGGIRTIERARTVLGYGATHVVVGSSLFRDGHVDVQFARQLAEAVGAARVIAAVDSRGGRGAIFGWGGGPPRGPLGGGG